MQMAILAFTSTAPGRWSAMALSSALCTDKKTYYGGRNPYRLLATVNGSLYRLCEMGWMERREEESSEGRVRYTYAITSKGRAGLKEMEN